MLSPVNGQREMLMQPSQCRAARALLDWTQPKLADAARLGLSTVVDLERSRRALSEDALAAIQRALEAAGVIFVQENGDGPGVRLRKAPEGVEKITERIDARLDRITDMPPAAEPSPEAGMNQMRRALAKDDLKKLKRGRTKARDKGLE